MVVKNNVIESKKYRILSSIEEPRQRGGILDGLAGREKKNALRDIKTGLT